MAAIRFGPLNRKGLLLLLNPAFFPYHDSVSYHNPDKNSSSLQESDFKNWYLNRLNKEEARRVYSFLKDKELFWQEKRRKEYINQRKMFAVKPLGGTVAPQEKG